MLRPGCEARCPGCAHRELSAVASEDQKSAWLKRALSPWERALEPIRSVQGEARWSYRDKTVLFTRLGPSQWEFGMRIPTERWGEFEFVAIPDCPVHSPRVRNSLQFLSKILPRELDLAFVAVSGAIVTLVLKRQDNLEELFRSRGKELSEVGIEGIFVNLNASAGQRVFLGHWNGRNWKKVWGESTALGPMGLKHGPQSFQQLTPALYKDALAEAQSWLKPGPGVSVLDLYTGVGASLRIWKEAGSKVLGVELLGEAVEIAGGDILQGRVSERLPQIEKWLTGPCAVFTNPPRTGMEPEVVDWLGQKARPSRIAYLSCSAGTLARDLSKLENSAYRVRRIIPYDFFPQTQHVESLALLELDDSGDSAPSDRVRRTE